MTAPLLRLDGFATAPQGRTLSLDVLPGEHYALMGTDVEGALKFLRAMAGVERPARGAVTGVEGRWPRVPVPSRRVTAQALATRKGLPEGTERAAVVLSALGLWDERRRPVAQLSPSKQAAAELVGALVDRDPLVFIAGQLDRFDPWTRRETLDLVLQGGASIVQTNLSPVAERTENVIVLKGEEPVFAGHVQELRRRHGNVEVTVETDDPSTVRAVVEPFAVNVTVVAGGVRLQAARGQEMAARLLTHGYGVVKAVIVREPTLDEALRHIVAVSI
ncbi:MAG: hypothetical protein KF733_03620 [Fimbriimonadaceae bacterium]|nr:MAG: hypothetical protein KF733_03620 [Fimbriimonadaceae bacterium]